MIELTRSVHLVFGLLLGALCATTAASTIDELQPTENDGLQNERFNSWFILEEDQLQLLASSSPELHRVIIADEWSSRTAAERYGFLSTHLRELWGAEQPDGSLNAVSSLVLIEDTDDQETVTLPLETTSGTLLHHYLHTERMYAIQQGLFAELNSRIENHFPKIAQTTRSCLAESVNAGNECSLNAESHFPAALKGCVTRFEGTGADGVAGFCVTNANVETTLRYSSCLKIITHGMSSCLAKFAQAASSFVEEQESELNSE